jgi:hypothetical protein
MTDSKMSGAQLVTRCNARELGVSLTSELDIPLSAVGQTRAVEAIDFARRVQYVGSGGRSGSHDFINSDDRPGQCAHSLRRAMHAHAVASERVAILGIGEQRVLVAG